MIIILKKYCPDTKKNIEKEEVARIYRRTIQKRA